MKRSDVGSIIQVLANVGVVAGLIFLALQLRQSTEVMRLDAYTAFVANRLSINAALVENPDLRAAFISAGNGEPMSADQQFLLERFYLTALTAWESEYALYRRGLLSEEDLPVAGWRAALQAWPNIGAYWERSKDFRETDFRSFVDAILLESTPTTDRSPLAESATAPGE